MRRVWSLVLIGFVVAGLGACSDDGGDETSSSAAESTTVAESTTTTTVDPAATPAIASAGCEAGTAVKVGEDERVDTTSGGEARWYYRRVPPAYDGATPVPVVVDLHGYSEGAAVHLMMSGLGATGDAEGFAVVTPHGTGPVPRWDTAFDSPDVAYIGDLLDEIESTLCVDRRRVYATGLSNGAFMSSALACVYADRIAAVAPVAGVQTPDGCTPTRPVPVVTFHGTDDGFVAFTGGLGEDALTLPAADGSGGTLGELDLPAEALEGPSVPETVAAWAERNGCGRELDAESLSTITVEPFADDVVLHEYDCPADASVRFFEIVGGGHTWPGSEFSGRLESVMGVTTFSVAANEQMWSFFVDHPLSTLSGSPTTEGTDA